MDSLSCFTGAKGLFNLQVGRAQPQLLAMVARSGPETSTGLATDEIGRMPRLYASLGMLCDV